MAKAHAVLGQVYLEEANGLAQAANEYEQAIRLLEKVNHSHPELPDQMLELALLHGDLNRIHQMAGKLDSALGSARKAAEILEQLNRQNPDTLEYEKALAVNYQMLSELHRARHEPAQALTEAQKAQSLLCQLVDRHPADTDVRIDLATCQNILGRLLQQTGEPVEALQSFQRAIDIYESMPKLDAGNSYRLASNIALSIGLIGVKNGTGESINPSKLTKADQLRRERYIGRAIELLRAAVSKGFQNIEILLSDSDLDLLRDRPDFQSLLKEVDGKEADTKP
jgi:tetratricopeptide (TPR) repeat protein